MTDKVNNHIDVTFTYDAPDDYLYQTNELGKTGTWTYNGPDKIWYSAAKLAAFTTVDINMVKIVGAPSYTSGVQKWNGAAEILNRKPTKINKTPIDKKIGVDSGGVLAMLVAIFTR